MVQYKEIKIVQSAICFIPCFTDFFGQVPLMPYILSSVKGHCSLFLVSMFFMAILVNSNSYFPKSYANDINTFSSLEEGSDDRRIEVFKIQEIP